MRAAEPPHEAAPRAIISDAITGGRPLRVASGAAGVAGLLAETASALRKPLEDERRSVLPIQVYVRWILVATALFIINVDPRSTGFELVLLNLLTLLAGAINAVMQWRLSRGGVIPVWLPVLAGAYDAIAIVIGLRIVEGFDNLNFVMFFPALLAFTILFPGLPSIVFAAGTLLAHGLLVTTHHSFDSGSTQDLKDLVVRLIALASTVLVANLAVGVERRLRARAVAAAVAAQAERQRVAREVHDGVAQGVYMLSVNLEANATLIEQRTADQELSERMQALVRLSKQTLLETRSLLYDVGPAMAGEEGLSSLFEHHAAEFSAVTGIPVSVRASGQPPELPPSAVSDLYRVLQEGLANVYKHAEATRADVRLSHAGGSVTLDIVDDGRGFDLDAARGRGHGLSNLQQRAERLGGDLAVETAPGRGTPAHADGARERDHRELTMAAASIRVMIVDDHEVVRVGLRSLLEMEPDIRVVAEAADGDQATAEARVAAPSVVLMDVRMGRTGGIEACRELKEALPDVRVLMLTSFGTRDEVLAALMAGASGFLLKNTGREELLRAVRAVAAGESLLDPAVTAGVTDRLVELAGQAEDPRIAPLSEREREVLRLVAQGQTNKEIAESLVISAATARNHVSHILEKLGMRSRTEAAALVAAELGLRGDEG